MAERLGIDAEGIRGIMSGDVCYINTARVRPSEVPKLVLEEIAGHRGLKAVFGGQYDSMLDGIYRDFFQSEEFQGVIRRYFPGKRLELTEQAELSDRSDMSDLSDQSDLADMSDLADQLDLLDRGRNAVSLETVEDQRYAAEEFLAHNARLSPELKPS